VLASVEALLARVGSAQAIAGTKHESATRWHRL
jgi:hypothetical protein